ncbi:hypothetical protein ZIOFF_041645 [Zingiber officinale]|uniref:Uncharacterized protein n=1 Tax=Zingiber officinale TaxID=94328 RepID=A0A8J5L1Q8_ZINOF|nr:hypothetical protein ZIOFF_041645 [Zingiber officinale]
MRQCDHTRSNDAFAPIAVSNPNPSSVDHSLDNAGVLISSQDAEALLKLSYSLSGVAVGFFLGRYPLPQRSTVTLCVELYGTDSSTHSPPNRIGQVSHSVVLGIVNISDQRELMGLLPDIRRVFSSEVV